MRLLRMLAVEDIFGRGGRRAGFSVVIAFNTYAWPEQCAVSLEKFPPVKKFAL